MKKSRKIKKSSEWFLPIVGCTAVAVLIVLSYSVSASFYSLADYAAVASSLSGNNQQDFAASKQLETTSSPIIYQQSTIGLPLRLEIPKIKINAPIDYVGLTSQGAMGIPTVPAHAAWFKLGVRPGEIGSAVISGHVNWYNGAYSIFLNLNKLKPGDKIAILDNQGTTIYFVVRKSALYGANQNAASIFNSDDGLAHLNLITCSGTWNKNAKQYSQRLVVFTDKE